MRTIITITTIIENTANEEKGYISEHGLSFHVSGSFGNILFDTGQSGGFLHNAKIMGIDLNEVDKIAISHGHYDHAGGIVPMIDKGFSQFKLYVSKGFFYPKYSTKEDAPRYNGVNFDANYIKEKGILLETITVDKYEMAKGIYLVGSFSEAGSIDPNPFFKVEKEGKLIIDDFSDEIAMVVEGEDSIVVLSGCAHPGIECMVDKIAGLFKKPIEAILGGTHLKGVPQKRLKNTSLYFKKSNIKYFGFSHCTGEESTQFLKKRLGSRFIENHVGDKYILK